MLVRQVSVFLHATFHTQTVARSAKSLTLRNIKIRLISCFLNVLQYQQYDIATP